MTVVSEPLKPLLETQMYQVSSLCLLLLMLQLSPPLSSTHLNSTSIPSSFVKPPSPINEVYSGFFFLWATILLGALLDVKSYCL